MAYTPEQLQTLKTELTTDPLARGYAGMGDDAAAASLNGASRTVPVESVSPADFLRGMVKTEWDALSATDRQYLGILLGNGPIDIRTGSQIRVALLAMFGAQSATRANLLAMLDRAGTRCEELELPPATPWHVAQARSL